MCLSLPGKVVQVADDTATIDYGAEQRIASTQLMVCAVGDWVVVSGGFILQKLAEEEARKALELWEEADRNERDSCC